MVFPAQKTEYTVAAVVLHEHQQNRPSPLRAFAKFSTAELGYIHPVTCDCILV
jgi:hypothetical protein